MKCPNCDEDPMNEADISGLRGYLWTAYYCSFCGRTERRINNTDESVEGIA